MSNRTFTIEEIRNYIRSQESRGDILHYLSEENIIAANQPKVSVSPDPDFATHVLWFNKQIMLIELNTAKSAKEKGFDWKCNQYYREFNHTGDDYRVKLIPCDNESRNHQSYGWQYNAPTQSKLQKWLREEHDIYVTPVPNFKDKFGQHHSGIVYKKESNVIDSFVLKDDTEFKNLKLFDTYEQALEEGLQQALKLIK